MIALVRLRGPAWPRTSSPAGGGTIVQVHRLGNSDAVLLSWLVHSVKRDDCRRGIMALFIGAGECIAPAIEIL